MDLSPFDLVIFDADDTLRRTLVPGQPCPHAPHEWELLPGVRDTLKRYDWSRRRFGIASNQDQVAYSLLPEHTARRLLEDLARAAIGNASRQELIRFCPHAEDAGCTCRKPRPGMILDLCATAGVPNSRTLFVGNSASDQECAARAGTSFVWAATFFRRRTP